MLKRYKHTLVFILLILSIPFFVFIFSEGISIPRDLGIIAFIDLMIFLILKNKIEINSIKKKILLTLTVLISILTPVWLLFLIMIFPGQKEADRILFDICIPAIQKYYEEKGQQDYLEGPYDQKGNSRYNYQVWECEQNMRDGKGPIFSDNPKEFKPVENKY